MTTLAGLAAILAFGLQGDPNDVAYFRRDFAAVTAGAQCRYADGSKSVLLRTKDPGRRLFIYREKEDRGYFDTVELMEFKADGHYDHDSNGGMTMRHMIGLAVDHLVRQRYEALTPRTLTAFLAATKVPKCARATFDADLYDEQGRY